jgi:NAD(P)-dependent dehydrogenase (short-subunit alcohol dehydrogenase family)
MNTIMKNTKSILVVGAEKGLGLGLVNEFLKRGYQVTGTSRPGADASALEEAGQQYPGQLNIRWIDINVPASVDTFAASLASEVFDIMFYNAGIFGPLHQSLLEVTDDEVTALFLTNAISPVRLAKKLIGNLPQQGGMIAFMTSHRASITNNTEGAVELYSASKAALNQLTRSLYFYAKPLGHTILNVHPGWVNTDMGTLNGTVPYEVELDESVAGVANVVEAHFGSGEHIYVDYQNNHLPW